VVEKGHGLTVSAFGIVLAVFELILACFIIYFAVNFSIMISGVITPPIYLTPAQMVQPLGYLVGLLNATNALLLIGGIYVLVHAIKRLIDHIFKTYIASKQ
jgi:uncharacterized membrane protein